jgi:hypothetical protein
MSFPKQSEIELPLLKTLQSSAGRRSQWVDLITTEMEYSSALTRVSQEFNRSQIAITKFVITSA